MQRIAYVDEVKEFPGDRVVVISKATRSRIYEYSGQLLPVPWWPQRRFGRALHRARRKLGLPV